MHMYPSWETISLYHPYKLEYRLIDRDDVVYNTRISAKQ